MKKERQDNSEGKKGKGKRKCPSNIAVLNDTCDDTCHLSMEKHQHAIIMTIYCDSTRTIKQRKKETNKNYNIDMSTLKKSLIETYAIELVSFTQKP